MIYFSVGGGDVDDTGAVFQSDEIAADDGVSQSFISRLDFEGAVFLETLPFNVKIKRIKERLIPDPDQFVPRYFPNLPIAFQPNGPHQPRSHDEIVIRPFQQSVFGVRGD